MSSQSKDRSPLLPVRHPTPDLFVCDIFDAAPKGDMASMEHPVFSLSTKPDRTARRYENGGIFVEVKPSHDGLATIHDRDILIYCISQLMSGMNSGREVSQVIRFRAHDLLKATNRMTNGNGYEGLKSALERLAGTRINTNIVTGGKEIFNNFGLIDRFEIVRETRDGRMQEVEIKLSDWVFNALRHNEVLTLSRDYFRLRKPIERRLYELARKHCGRQSEWRISIELLHKKSGATSSLREFRRLLGNIVDEDEAHSHIPEYAIRFDGDKNLLFINRGTLVKLNTALSPLTRVFLSDQAYADARSAASGWDVYYLEQQWRAWMTEPPFNPDAAFVGFCKSWFERKGLPR